jgi:hypothetical protein
MPNKATQLALWIGVLLLAVLVWGRPGQAQSQAQDQSIDSLVGENAVLFLRDFPMVERREIIQIHGKVTAAVDQGVWFKPINRRFKVDKKGDDKRPYAGPLFVPWTSISYVKVMR